MPDSGMLALSLFSVVGGITFILFPGALLRFSSFLNRTIGVFDQRLMRYRYALGVLLFLLSYGLFRLALLLPSLGR